MRAFKLFILFFLSFSLHAQILEIGRPFIKNYTSKEYKTTPYNYGIVQDERGLIYIANYAGLLVYDGVEWQQIPVPNNYIYSIHKDFIGRIFIGSNGEFGQIKIDSLGGFYYAKISQKIKEKTKYNEVWNIKSNDSAVFFLSNAAIFEYSKGTIRTHRPTSKFLALFSVDKDIYATDEKSGLLIFKKNRFTPAPSGAYFIDKRIKSIIQQNGALWLFAEKEICILDKNQPSKEIKVIPIDYSNFQVSPILKDARSNADGSFLIQTNMGIFAMTSDGLIFRQISSQNTTIQNDNINASFVDKENGLWCALQNGISRVSPYSPISVWDKSNSTVKDAATRFIRHAGTLYLGTSDGVYSLKNDNYIKIAESKGYVTGFESFITEKGPILLYSTMDGIYQIIGEKPIQIFDRGVFAMAHLEGNPQYLMISTSDQEMGFLAYEQRKWCVKQLKKCNYQTKGLLEKEKTIWGRTSRHGIWSLDISKELNVDNIKLYDTLSGLPALTENYIFQVRNQICVGTAKGAYRYQGNGKFSPDPTFGKKFYKTPINVFLIHEDANKDVWIHSSKDGYREITKLRKNEKGVYVPVQGVYEVLAENKFSSIYSDAQGKVMLAGVDNVFQVNTKIANPKKTKLQTLIRKVFISPDSLIFNGNFFENTVYFGDTIQKCTMQQNENQFNKISYKYNSLIFHYAFPSFDKTEKNVYSYRMIGYDEEWSSWSNETKKEYTNLMEGKYTFEVRARNIYGEEGEVARYTFQILAPWYRSWAAYIIYVMLLALFIWGLVKINIKRLEKEKERLENIVLERTAELREKNVELEQQKEEILAQSEQLEMQNMELEKLSIAASETDNSIVIADKNGKVEWANAAFTRMTGFTLTEFIALKGTNILTTSENPDIQEIMNRCISSHKSVVYAIQNTTKDGRIIWVQTTLTPIIDLSGNISKLIAIDSDITKIKEAEALIQFKNKQITDSISYAKRIQQAILPPKIFFDEFFKDTVIYFKPKEIVSGDFYYMTKHQQRVYVAVADCTGHGVPGAFMSMIGYSLLNEIIVSKDILEPQQILQELHTSIYNALHQNNIDDSSQDDGMDISLICFDFANNTAVIAGANQTPIMIFNEEVNQYKTSFFSIGEPRAIKKNLEFSQTTVELKKGQKYFLFSDGFQDQFGGDEEQKFQKKNLISLLSANTEMMEIPEKLEDTFINWTQRGDICHSQIDDILILGIQI